MRESLLSLLLAALSLGLGGLCSAHARSPEETGLQQQPTQKLGGIGIELRFDRSARELRVTTPLPKTPAYRAGIRAEDTIVQIDGKPTSDFPKGKELQTAATLLRGMPGSAVAVGLKHAGSGELRQIAIVRALIRLPAVKGDTLKSDGSWDFMLNDDGKIGYVRIIHFGPQSAGELENALDELKPKGMKALILDLRNNPGGSLSQAIKVADLFLQSGIIVTVTRRDDPDQIWYAKEEGTIGELPMAVLVNRASAGAAEIVAACLQDHRRAIVVGERTYGRGTNEFKGIDGPPKTPVATLLRPNGKSFDRAVDPKDSTRGIEPNENHAVRLSREEYGRFRKHRRTRDVFNPEDPPKSDFQDRQLQKAIDCL